MKNNSDLPQSPPRLFRQNPVLKIDLSYLERHPDALEIVALFKFEKREHQKKVRFIDPIDGKESWEPYGMTYDIDINEEKLKELEKKYNASVGSESKMST